MNLWVRVLIVLLRGLWRRLLRHPRLGVLSESVMGYRVMPTDLDLNMHMTNARYLSFMDLGRTDLILRTGLARVMMRHKLQAVIGGTMVRFRRSLAPFQRFEVHSRLIAWDDRWLYIEQVFYSRGQMICSARVKGAFLHKGAIVDPASLFVWLGEPADPQPVPDWVTRWNDAEARAFAV